jgi:hypothetical protein
VDGGLIVTCFSCIKRQVAKLSDRLPHYKLTVLVALHKKISDLTLIPDTSTILLMTTG